MRRFVAVVACLCACAPGVYAADDKPKDEAARSNRDTLSAIRTVSDYMDHIIVNHDGKELGTIQEMLFDRMGHCRFLLLSHDDSEDYIAVPWRALKSDREKDRAYLEMEVDKFHEAPARAIAGYNENPNEWAKASFDYFGVEWKDQEWKDIAAEADKTTAEAKKEPCFFRASRLTGATLQDVDGEKLGSVDDIILNDRGRMAYVIVGHGGVLKIGEKDVAIPFRSVAVRPGEQDTLFVVLDMTKEQLESAPTLVKDKYADLLDADYVDANYRYFGVSDRAEIEAKAKEREKNKEEPRKE